MNSKLGLFLFCAVTVALSACGNDPVVPTDDGGLPNDSSVNMDMLVTTDMNVPFDGTVVSDGSADGGDASIVADGAVFDSGRRDSGVSLAAALAMVSEMLCAPAAEALCEGLEDCGCGTFGEGRSCVDTMRASCEDGTSSYAELIASGDGVLVPSLVTACIAELSAAASSCVSPSNWSDSACNRFVTEATPVGTRCISSPSEGSYMYCANAEGFCPNSLERLCTALPSMGSACFTACASPAICLSGVCAAPQGEGLSCGDSGDCEAGLVCIDNVCTGFAALGATCDATHRCHPTLHCADGSCVANPDFCEVSSDCASGTSCVGEAYSECSPLLDEGANCDGGECAPGLFCNYSGEVFTCTTLPEEGEDCADSGRCVEGQYCYGDGSANYCRPLPVLGEECAEMRFIIFGGGGDAVPAGGAIPRDFRICADGLGCATDNTCQLLPTIGQPCSTEGLCSEGLSCNGSGSSPICVERGTAGATCFSDDMCNEAFYCDWRSDPGTCVDRLGSGASCESTRWCSPGLSCVYNASFTEATCEVTPALGESCSGDCVSGTFCARRLRDGECLGNICSEVGGPRPDEPIPL